MHQLWGLSRSLLKAVCWAGLVCCYAAVAESTFAYEERIFQIGEVWATETEMTDSGAPEQSTVLLIHGWAGQMDEVGDMYKRLARQLAERGIPSLRINIRGESERDQTSYRLTSTFASRVADADTGFSYLVEKYPEATLGIVGFSLGGATALALTGKYPDQIDSLLLWSSVGNPDLLFRDLTRDQRQQVMDEGEITLPYWVDLTITKQHMLGFDGYDLFPDLIAYQGAIFSIRGTQDYVPPQEEKIFAAASAAPERSWLIEGADHIFNVLEPESTYDQALIEASIDWLVETLN